MIIDLETEGNIVKHGFLCRLEPGTEEIIIQNAQQSNYEKGWKDYAPFESIDGNNWQRVSPGKYADGKFSFAVHHDARFISWFPPYHTENITKLAREFGQTDKNVIILGGSDKKRIILLAGQHPGETMGVFFVEGVLKALKDIPEVLNNFSFAIYPTVNRAGMENGNHRLTPDGIDLNRSWNKINSITGTIKKEIKQMKNILAVIDVHGDEISKKDYLMYGGKFDKLSLADTFRKQGFEFIKGQCFLKRFLKNLIRQHRIILPKGKTARQYFSKQGLASATVELSAHTNTPKTCIDKGYHFVSNLR